MNQTELDKILADFFRYPVWTQKPQDNYPPYNLSRKGGVYTLEFAVAGWRPDQIEVEVDRDSLNIRGTPDKSEEEMRTDLIHHGISKRAFRRNFKLGKELDSENIEVRMENGLLVIEMRVKQTEVAKVKRLEIKS